MLKTSLCKRATTRILSRAIAIPCTYKLTAWLYLGNPFSASFHHHLGIPSWWLTAITFKVSCPFSNIPSKFLVFNSQSFYPLFCDPKCWELNVNSCESKIIILEHTYADSVTTEAAGLNSHPSKYPHNRQSHATSLTGTELSAAFAKGLERSANTQTASSPSSAEQVTRIMASISWSSRWPSVHHAPTLRLSNSNATNVDTY